MRKRAVALSILILFQFASAIAFVPFTAHLTYIWNYHQKLGWRGSFLDEFTRGGNIMLVEAVVIFVALLATVGFEVWLIVKGFKEDKEMKEQLKDMSEKIDILTNEIRQGRNERKSKPR
jgi:hypothetical protein